MYLRLLLYMILSHAANILTKISRILENYHKLSLTNKKFCKRVFDHSSTPGSVLSKLPRSDRSRWPSRPITWLGHSLWRYRTRWESSQSPRPREKLAPVDASARSRHPDKARANLELFIEVGDLFAAQITVGQGLPELAKCWPGTGPATYRVEPTLGQSRGKDN